MYYSKSFVVISTVFPASSPGVDSISRNHFYCSSIVSKSSSFKFWLWGWSNLITTPVPTSISSSLAISTTAVSFSTEVFNPSTSFLRVAINFVQIPVNVDNLTSFHESQIFLMPSGMVNLFQRVFNLLFPDQLEESLSIGALILKKCIS